MPKITSSKIIYDSSDWLGGLNAQYGLSGVLGNDFQSQRAIDPYRYYGYLSPGYLNETVDNASTVLGAVVRNAVNNGAYAYLIEGGTKLHRMTIAGGALLNDSAGVGFPHTITAHAGHNTVLGRDCVLYDAKVGGTSAKRFFYCWSDNTDWDIGVCDMNTTTPSFDDDFMTTAPATPLSGYDAGKDYVHPMVVGADDILYIGDRNYLHAYDGQNTADDDGKFFPAVLTLPAGWIITGMAKMSESLVIFAYYSASGSGDGFYYGESKAFFWDYLSSDPYRIKNLNDNTVVDGFEYLGTVACITSGRPDGLNIGKTNRLQIFNGSEFEEVAVFGGNPPIRGGVDILGRQIRWLCSTGTGGWYIYSWRNNFDNSNKLNIIGEISGGENYTSGFLRSFSQFLFVGSTGTGSAGKVEKMNTSKFNQSSVFYTSLTDFPNKIRLTKIRIKFRNSTNNRSFTLSIGDRSYDYTVISNLSTIDATNIVETTGLGQDTSGNIIPALNSIRLIGSWGSGGATDDGTTAPITSSIEIDYEPVEFI